LVPTLSADDEEKLVMSLLGEIEWWVVLM